MSLASLRAKLDVAQRQLDAPPKRLAPARVLTGGEVVSAVKQADPAMALRREPSALIRETGVKPLKRLHQQLEREGVIDRFDALSTSLRPLDAIHTRSPFDESLSRQHGSAAKLAASKSTPSISPRKPTLPPTASSSHLAPLLSYEDLRQDALQRAGGLPDRPTGFSLSDARDLRVRRRPLTPSGGPAAGGGGRSLPAHIPSNRSEAIRLGNLLETLLAVGEGGWERQTEVHDEAFAEVVLQVANHCAERGELLQRLRKFYQICVRLERECREDLRRSQEELRVCDDKRQHEEGRANTLEEECIASRDKLDALRAGLVRLKLMRAVHGRKLAASELRCVRERRRGDAGRGR